MGYLDFNLTRKRSILISIIGILAFLLYLYFFVGFEDILYVFQQIDPFEYLIFYSLAIITTFLGIVFYTLSWHELLKILAIKINFLKAFQYSWVAIFVDLVIPLEAVSGEIARVYILHRDSNENIGKITASVIIHRVISNIVALGGFTVASISLIVQYFTNIEIFILLAIVLILTLISIIFLIYISINQVFGERVITGLIRIVRIITRNKIKLDNIEKRIKHVLSIFYSGMKTYQKKRKMLIKPFIFSMISWLLQLIVYYLVFFSLGFKSIIFEVIVVSLSIGMVIQTLPFSLPVGPTEITMASIFRLFGIPKAISGTATTMIRIVTYWFYLLIGYIVAQWIGMKTLLNRDRKNI
jgi:uncharacterized protein (TIRG00374 family)